MSSLIPNPLHPAVVHLPVALAVLLPLFAIGALIMIRRGAKPRVAWGVTTALAAALAASAWVATQTGEQQEERVEDVVGEASLHSHEEAAEAFLALSVGVLVVTAAGLAGGAVGRAGRVLGAAGTVALFVAGWRVGHTGGQLVYRDGAASAYVATARGDGATSEAGAPSEATREREGGRNERRGGDRQGEDGDDR